VLGGQLRKARESAGLTQEELASRAGLTREYISHLERDRYSPTVDVLVRLCASMQTRAWRVLRRVEERG
jgi:transcriptional regulator with XRE-family HTH domain